MSNPFHGIQILESSGGRRPASNPSQSVIYLVATADDADPDTFPANEQVLLTDVRGAIGDAGTEGTLRSALIAIAEQCNPILIVMRVPEGANANETAANVIGSTNGAVYTGLQGARVSRQKFDLAPKIIGAPGLETLAVVTAGVSVAQAVHGMFYANAFAANKEDAVTFRGNFAARELILLWPNVIRFDTAAGQNVTAPSSAFALGLRAKIDAEHGWHKTLSNVPINGIIGLANDVSFDVLSPANDAGYLNGSEITTVIRSEGFRFWGNRTTSDDASFAFESYTRTAQYLRDMAAAVLKAYIDKPLSLQTLRDMVESLNGEARALITNERLIGGEFFIDPARNQPQQLNAGQVRIGCTYTPVPPMEALTLDLTITDEYFFDFAQALAA
jgi:phage tail sheath protein FI